MEPTVGDESNFSDQVARKEARYNRELIPGSLGKGWKARLFTVEIGCRGFWHHTLPALSNYFSVTKSQEGKEDCIGRGSFSCFLYAAPTLPRF